MNSKSQGRNFSWTDRQFDPLFAKSCYKHPRSMIRDTVTKLLQPIPIAILKQTWFSYNNYILGNAVQKSFVNLLRRHSSVTIILSTCRSERIVTLQKRRSSVVILLQPMSFRKDLLPCQEGIVQFQ